MTRSERVFIAITCAHLVFLPWPWGTMHAWSQALSFGFAMLGFAVSLQTRTSDDAAGMGEVWRRLRAFPVFWLGLALLGLVVIQACNPSWIYQRDATHWWMRRVPSVSWLPTSVVTPFSNYNIWRVFLVLASAWLLACSVWLGARRRRVLLAFLVALTASGSIVSIVGIAHRMSGDSRVLWLREFKSAVGFGPFVYHNHGAAYVALVGLTSLALAAWFHDQARFNLARSSPSSLFVIAWLATVIAIVVSGSRAGLALVVVFSLVALGSFIATRRYASVRTERDWAHGALLVLLMLWGAFMFSFASKADIWRKFDLLREKGGQEWSVRQRFAAQEQGFAMFKDHWLRGSGAGSFRYMFVPYARRNPEVDDNGKALWEFLHNDWLQTGIEYGVVGSALFGAMLLWCVWRWVRLRGWSHAVSSLVMIACLQTLFHAWVDFPFQNPAIFATWALLVILGLRWLELDRIGAGLDSRGDQIRRVESS